MGETQIAEGQSPTVLRSMAQRAIAVLPSRVTASDKAGRAYLNLADPIITNLSLARQIIVRPTSASQKFNTPYGADSVGFALCVDFVVDTCIKQIGERILAVAQLVRVLDGKSLWQKEYEDHFQNIALIENSISQQVALALNLLPSDEWERSTRRHPANSAAYRQFKMGRILIAEGRFDKAIASFRRAIREDESYALAYVGLAECYLWIGIYNADSPKKTFSNAKELAIRALEMEGPIADAYSALGYAYMFEGNWSDAEKTFRLAIQLNPNCATAHQGYAHLLTALRRFPEAQEEIERALEIDPFSPIINLVKGFVLYYSGEYFESLEQFQYTVSLNRRSHAAYYALTLAYMVVDRFRDGMEAIHKAKRFSHNDAQKRAVEAYCLALLGRKAEAQQVLKKLKEESKRSYISQYQIAAIHSELEDPEAAFECLKRALEDKDQWLVLLRDDPRFTKLEGHAEYDKLVQLLDFPAPPKLGMLRTSK